MKERETETESAIKFCYSLLFIPNTTTFTPKVILYEKRVVVGVVDVFISSDFFGCRSNFSGGYVQ